MSESPQDQTPKYDFTAEDIKDANAGDTNAIAERHADSLGGYYESEEGTSEESFIENMRISDAGQDHAAKVQRGVAEMYEDAYAENEQHSADSGEK